MKIKTILLLLEVADKPLGGKRIQTMTCQHIRMYTRKPGICFYGKLEVLQSPVLLKFWSPYTNFAMNKLSQIYALFA